MLTKTGFDSRHPESKGKPIVYVDYLESASWNWNIKRLGQEGTYKAVGSLLFRHAIVQSKEEDFRGRVGLHALPQASDFYEGLGMVKLANDSANSNLPYFELTEAAVSVKKCCQKGAFKTIYLFDLRKRELIFLGHRLVSLLPRLRLKT